MNPKQAILAAARGIGVNALVAASGWRRRRLLILCYHGVSLRDEHEADPALYVSAEFFRRRLEVLARGGFRVLRLGEAMERLYAGTLPPKAVVLTFDDGTRDFAEVATPLLREFGMPATVYVTTYYCRHPFPVFDTALRYVLWRGRSRSIDLGRVVAGGGMVSLESESNRDGAWQVIYSDAIQRGLSAVEKQDVLRRVAAAVGVDMGEFLATGMYQQMTPQQIHDLPTDLIDVQLHTHRHRTPRTRDLFDREILENRRALANYLQRDELKHFCYPSGDYWGEFVGWLHDSGVVSATTCVPALSTTRSDRMLLPRFLDSAMISDVLFDAWICGVAHVLPRRAANRYDADRLAGVQATPSVGVTS